MLLFGVPLWHRHCDPTLGRSNLNQISVRLLLAKRPRNDTPEQ